MNAPPRGSSQAGFFTITAMFVGLLLLGLSVSFLGDGLTEARDVSQYESSTLALELAESGLIRSELEFLSQVDAAADGLGNVQGAWRGGDFDVQTFSVVAVPAGGPGVYTLTSTGTHRHGRRRVELGLKVTKPFRFLHAIFAKDRLTVGSSVATDSYDSRLGTYASQATRSDALGPYAEATGHVGSNNRIEVGGSARVRGDARPGPGFTSSLVGGSSYVAGSRTPMAEPYEIPLPTLEEFTTAYLTNDDARDCSSGVDRVWNATRKSISVNSNATLRLRGGTYFFSDFLFDGNATLQVDAPSKIYVTRRLVFNSSSRINYSGRPVDLQFIAHPYALTPSYTPPPDDITFTSSVNAAFTLYAPGRNVTLNSSLNFYGAIVGNRVVCDSSVKVHYDRALGEAGGTGGVEVERLYWRDLTPMNR